MRPTAGQVLHFSEDPRITHFEPHVAATARQSEPYVWALDAEQAPSYWFPRDCPRVLAWPGPETAAADRRLVGDRRTHTIEYGWLPALQSVRLYAYRFAAAAFHPFGSPWPHAMVATTAVTPLGPAEPVGDLLAAHEAAGIELRLVDDLWPIMDGVVRSSLRFSGIRLRNARPRK
ncbi:hypothetical protein GCM10020358_48050 [Amorphoplanes nipponensis]|uniref:Uncharacterized protein n=1 Tax=Actinoplanes nipponensis TaxID=135950 RepID=A0A919MHB6_9ACTN|nr:DUF6886 family protein [Actinoplanes nipponensis]GIE49504.1 hypothetical protein Ani05nite_30380 [Actinoplanes nipponensis]